MRVALFATSGGLVGGIAAYVFLNTSEIEVLAAQADGFPLWSMYQVPFAIPGAVNGAVFGLITGFIARAISRRSRHKR